MSVSALQIDKIAYVHTLKELAIPVANQGAASQLLLAAHPLRASASSHTPKVRRTGAITKDNVSLMIDGVLYVKV